MNDGLPEQLEPRMRSFVEFLRWRARDWIDKATMQWTVSEHSRIGWIGIREEGCEIVLPSPTGQRDSDLLIACTDEITIAFSLPWHAHFEWNPAPTTDFAVEVADFCDSLDYILADRPVLNYYKGDKWTGSAFEPDPELAARSTRCTVRSWLGTHDRDSTLGDDHDAGH